MNRESKCEHDIAEQETAVAEHLCPLCLEVKVIGLAGLRKATIKLWYEEQARRQAAEAKYQNDLNAAIAIVIAISEPTGHADTFESLTAEWVDRMIEAEAKLEAMRKLVTDWRIEIPKLLLVGPEAANALASCADELEALLKEQTK